MMAGNNSEFTCQGCGKLIGHLITHPKYPSLQVLNLGNLNIAESYHGRCGVCHIGIHFDWRWELAARVFVRIPLEEAEHA
jgi:hypothetical protein